MSCSAPAHLHPVGEVSSSKSEGGRRAPLGQVSGVVQGSWAQQWCCGWLQAPGSGQLLCSSDTSSAAPGSPQPLSRTCYLEVLLSELDLLRWYVVMYHRQMKRPAGGRWHGHGCRLPHCHSGRMKSGKLASPHRFPSPRPPSLPRCSPLTLQGVEDREEVELGDEKDAEAEEGQAPGGSQQAGEPQHRCPVPPRLPLLALDPPQHYYHGRQHQRVEEQDEASVAEGDKVGQPAGEPAPDRETPMWRQGPVPITQGLGVWQGLVVEGGREGCGHPRSPHGAGRWGIYGGKMPLKLPKAHSIQL